MRVFLISVLLSISFLAQGQKDRKDYDTTYLKEFSHNFYPYTFSNIKNHNLYFSHLNKENNWVNYTPNSPLYLGFGFDYKWMTVSYAFPLQSKSEKKGSNFNVFYGMSRRKFRLSLMYQQYQGFFQDDPNLPDEWWERNNQLPFRKDISDYIFQGVFFYIFNHQKVSYRSSFLYFEKQKKSAGSLTLGTNFFVSGVSADSALIPSTLDSAFQSEIKKERVLDVNIGLKIGYMYTWVFHKNWHLSAHFAPALYVNRDRLFQERISGDSVSNFGRSLFLGLDYRVVLGYDNDQYFGGVMLFGTNTRQDLKTSSFSSDYTVVELYFGKRMNLHLRRKDKRKILE